MLIDTAKIDAELAKAQEHLAKAQQHVNKLQDLKRLACDPEMMPLLESSAVSNGSGHQADRPQPSLPPPSPEHSAKKGDLLEAVRKAVATFTGPFTSQQVLEVMRRSNFKFEGDPMVAVNGRLRNLVDKKNEVIVVEVGTGRRASRYERQNAK